ncbi:L-serine ammonia-lyase [Sphingobium sp. 22B]|uniref:L-serine ammonia-lyase, iron-sulfur-dependent, subunit alpha n=1 Tax=Sphingobium sp. 22B TaxID=936474 RepID=UPI000780DF75|nr:L-serine ammonia-lyase, iron-sulfur-dependent, subunit alpha [Sphingobium sp. 22B]KYC32601.1 L-serine ammonia-lyase [Sphingobium sp. 22B]
MTKSRIDAAAAISVMDLFTIGIGPSSSHTVGPMRAALMFIDSLPAIPARVQCELYGSLALTGRGHATDMAILLGLSGQRPDSVDPDAIADILATIRSERRIRAGSVEDRFVPFDETTDLLFRMGEFLEAHSNGMRFSAWFDGQEEPLVRDYYSVGGGAVLPGAEAIAADAPLGHNVVQPYPFSSGAEMLALGESTGLSIATLVLRNEGAWRAPRETEAFLDSVIDAMSPAAFSSFTAVLHYYRRFVPGADREGERRFLLTAAAMGFLYKKRASISAAEMGCQGEVGVACSMAAAGLAAVLGGTNQQVENAAEIGMEHNLGLTCDPIGGLVQIPCIERNTMGAVKAINAAYLALQGDGRHIVSLDAVIETMRQTGEDMASRYKETSLGGLAVNVVEC